MKNKNYLLVNENKSTIRSETITYGKKQIGDDFQNDHGVTIREK